MGIDRTGFAAIDKSSNYIKKHENALTIGRQGIHMGQNPPPFCEEMLKARYKFNNIDSMDYSDYEEATIIQDLNKQIPDNLKKYDFIFDGGSIEHVFNVPQALENMIELLEVGGIFCSINGNNNFSGHGMYQFSPELFLSCFVPKYGMQIKEMYLAVRGSDDNNLRWIDVYNQKYTCGNRTTQRFGPPYESNEIYIIVIAQKISNERATLLESPPYQNSYENYDWEHRSVN
jgi:SAM-dependent methyltransferase